MAKRGIKKKRKRRPRLRRLRTARKQTPAAPSTRAVEAVLAGVAHDIRTPLTGIVALAELLAASDLGAREREWANALKSGADHLAALTTLIVDAVKADAAGLALRREPFSPRRLAEAVGTALAARAGNKAITADIALAASLPEMALGDALRLRAALENLADNAVKFTRQGTVVFTAAAKPAGRTRLNLIFTVADTGIGIDARTLKSLFRPFAQASEAISRRYGGAGLGLVFVKRIAEAMGGSLFVTSKTGRGTTFQLIVPVDRMDAPASAAAAGASAGAAHPLGILCVEDNPYGRVAMNTILTEFGHRVDFVETGEAAVKAAARGGYDAVLMDVTLAGVDGLEATRRIRALAGTRGQVPVIGISGRGTIADEAAARAAGMNFYFVKPVSPRKLAEALNALSDRPRGSGNPG
jgi:CheY-like chemotaxis protein/nitrogen-specific signal transduction histidine kinase